VITQLGAIVTPRRPQPGQSTAATHPTPTASASQGKPTGARTTRSRSSSPARQHEPPRRHSLSAGTARTLGRAPNAGPPPVCRSTHLHQRFPVLTLQATADRRLMRSEC